MASRTRYLLSYDIRDPRRLRQVHRVALEYGEPLQYSVFVCDLTTVERARLRSALSGEIDHSVDSVAMFDLGPATGRGAQCVEHLGASKDVVNNDPSIW